jgi:hypothetical protein
LKNGLIFIQFPHVELQHLPLSCNWEGDDIVNSWGSRW